MVSISLKYFGIVKTCILANLKPALTSNITRKKKNLESIKPNDLAGRNRG